MSNLALDHARWIASELKRQQIMPGSPAQATVILLEHVEQLEHRLARIAKICGGVNYRRFSWVETTQAEFVEILNLAKEETDGK
ncbi:MAG TPA: hypothetical protein VNA25_20280 [Phycisphaerae bacterium]|nr:hypothetical protein [Phycisphaerae bacterium]